MIHREEQWQLLTDHFIVNVALPENFSSGLINISKDPRRQRIKPDAYIGIVEEISPTCRMVKVGDKVVFERWEYQQFNLDDERLIARERDLIVLDGSVPAPNVIVLELINNDEPKTSIIVPQTLLKKDAPYYYGKILATGAAAWYGEVGEELYVEAFDHGQFKDGKGKLFFRTGKWAKVMMRVKREAVLEVI